MGGQISFHLRVTARGRQAADPIDRTQAEEVQTSSASEILQLALKGLACRFFPVCKHGKVGVESDLVLNGNIEVPSDR